MSEQAGLEIRKGRPATSVSRVPPPSPCACRGRHGDSGNVGPDSRLTRPMRVVDGARWSEPPHDAPMTGIERNRIIGASAMISRGLLGKGTFVLVHQRVNEQFSPILRGRLRFALRDRRCELSGGGVIHFPSGAPHGAGAVEDSEILDIFEPRSPAHALIRRRRIRCAESGACLDRPSDLWQPVARAAPAAKGRLCRR